MAYMRNGHSALKDDYVDESIDEGAVYTGIIKSFNPQRGWGLISCDETFSIYNKDMFVLKSSLPDRYAEQGEEVTFTVIQGEKGPEAANVQFGLSGVIKSFNPLKGWGLISCEETFQEYGKDIFVLKTSLPNYHANQGDAVRFSVIQSEKGPEATNVRFVAPKVWAPIVVPVQQLRPQQQQVLRPSPNQGRVPVGGSQLQLHKIASTPGFSPSDQRLFQMSHAGTIKSYNDVKGWGFITPTSHPMNAFSKDVFLMRTSLGGQEVVGGERVQFKIAMGQKGLEATEIRLMPELEEFDGQLFSGLVKSYNVEKGWGFIASESIMEMFGRDIFFHKRDVGDQPPEAGVEVQFTVTASPEGHPQATNLDFGASRSSYGTRSLVTKSPRVRPY